MNISWKLEDIILMLCKTLTSKLMYIMCLETQSMFNEQEHDKQNDMFVHWRHKSILPSAQSDQSLMCGT